MDLTPRLSMEKGAGISSREGTRLFSLTGTVIFLIGHLFKLSYSAVSKVYQRFSVDVKTNKPPKKITYGTSGLVLLCQGLIQTPFRIGNSFCRPDGTQTSGCYCPGNELPGYFRVSPWDKFGVAFQVPFSAVIKIK